VEVGGGTVDANKAKTDEKGDENADDHGGGGRAKGDHLMDRKGRRVRSESRSGLKNWWG